MTPTTYVVLGIVAGAIAGVLLTIIIGACMAGAREDEARADAVERHERDGVLFGACQHAIDILMAPRSESEDEDDERTAYAADRLARAMEPFGYERCADCGSPVKPEALTPLKRIAPPPHPARIDRVCESCRKSSALLSEMREHGLLQPPAMPVSRVRGMLS